MQHLRKTYPGGGGASSTGFSLCPYLSLGRRKPRVTGHERSMRVPIPSGRITSHKSQLTPPRAAGSALAVGFLRPTSNLRPRTSKAPRITDHGPRARYASPDSRRDGSPVTILLSPAPFIFRLRSASSG